MLIPYDASDKLIRNDSRKVSIITKNWSPCFSAVLPLNVKFHYGNIDSLLYTYVCSKEVPELADVTWENLGFVLVPTDYMYMMKCSGSGMFTQGELQRFGNIELSPSSGVLNYGQVSAIISS